MEGPDQGRNDSWQVPQQKHPEIVIGVHRDRDYLSDEEVMDLNTSFTKQGINFFCTTGVDCESHFISVEHLKQLNLGLPDLKLQEAIANATEMARQDSIDRFINQRLGSKKPLKSDYAGELREINESYIADTSRYRYGKKVLGLLKAQLQTATKNNVSLEVLSTALKNADLQQIAAQIK